MATTTKGIYYPNDGTKAADVLTDLKQMAESIDETIGKEVSDNKYNDTEIKKDISDIKKEQETQNADIEKINQNVDTLEEQIPVSKNKGEVIKLIDSSNMNAVKFNIFGNQIQDGTPTEQNPIAIQTVNQKINLTVSNENLAVMNGIETDVELTENGIKIINTERINYLSTFKIKKGQTIKVGLKMLTAVTGNTSISCYVNGKYNDDLKFTSIKDYKINELQERSYTATEDCEINFSLSGNTNNEMSEFQLWANLDKLGEYTVAKNQTLSVDVQQEMLIDDTLKNENGNWKEVHNWQKITSYNGESIKTDYISSTGALTIGATVYYRLTTPTELNCTQTQIEQLNTLANISTYKNVTYIYSTDTISPIFEITYRKDLATLEKKYENKNIEQDELITKLQEDNQKLKNALLNAETEEAKSLYVTDANKYGSLEVLGNHKQEMRSGKNLLNFSSLTTQTVNGLTITNNNDGSITLNGTTTDIVSMTLSQTMHNLVAGNYYLSRNSSGTASGTFTNILYGNNGTAVNVANLVSEGMPLTTTTDYEEYYLWLYITSGITFTNYTIKPQLEAGTVKTDWEQYGAMPSPNYPSEVVCLGSNVKNIFTETNVLSDVYLNRSHEIVEDQDYVMYYFEVEPNQNYVLSFKYTQNLVELGKIGYGFSDSVPFIGQELEAEDTYSIFGNKVNGKVIIPSKKYLIFNFMKSMYNTMYDIQLEKGTEVTSYSPPGQGSTKISKINENLFDNKFEIGIIDSDGTERTASSAKNIRTKNYTRVFAGHNYTIINGIKNNLLKGRLYDINKNFIGVSTSITSNTDDLIKKYIPDEGVAFIRFQLDFDNAETGQAVIDGEYPFAIYQDSDDTDYIEHEQTDYILDIQQEMLEGDYFVREADGWKEVHGGNKIIFDGTENIITYTQEPFARYIYMGIQNIIKKPSVSAETGKILCNYYKTVSATATYQGTEGISVDTSGNIIFRDAEKSSVEGFKQFLQEKYNAGNPIYVHYKTATSTKLPCTQAQSAVLEELSNLELFDSVNNIITAEDIALLKLKYALDVKTYVNNLIASQTTESEG